MFSSKRVQVLQTITKSLNVIHMEQNVICYHKVDIVITPSTVDESFDNEAVTLCKLSYQEMCLTYNYQEICLNSSSNTIIKVWKRFH